VQLWKEVPEIRDSPHPGTALIGGHENEFRLACTLVCEAQHLVAGLPCLDAGTHFGDDARQIAPLSRRKCGWPAIMQPVPADHGLAAVDLCDNINY